LVGQDTQLADFHSIIQKAMGWGNFHLHHFISNGKLYSERMKDDGFWNEKLNVDYSGMTIAVLLQNKGDTIKYEYDFGDSWMHTLTLEDILPDDPLVQLPSCIGAQGYCPSENSGGPSQYTAPPGKKSPKLNLKIINYILSGDQEDDNEADPIVDERSYKDILFTTMTKREILFTAQAFGMKIKTSQKKEACASLLEQKLLDNPALLKNGLSYSELKTLHFLFTGPGDPEPNRPGDSEPDATGSAPAATPAPAPAPVATPAPAASLTTADNQASAKQELPFLDDGFHGLSFFDLEGLMVYGLVTPTLPTGRWPAPLYVPLNMKEQLLPELEICLQDEKLKKADHIEHLIIGITTLYGALPAQKIRAIINDHLPEPLTIYEFYQYLISQRCLRRCEAINTSNGFTIYHESIPDIYDLLARIDKRKNLEYALFEESELIKATNRLYYYENTFSERLLDHMVKYDLLDPDFFMHEIWFHIQTENSGHSLVAYVSERLNFKSLEELQETIKYLTDYLNNIPRWKLKGNIPASLSKKSRRSRGPATPAGFQIVTGQPGRDDPCPCGSGKKFKECCGNN